jgi:hypothetical protein
MHQNNTNVGCLPYFFQLGSSGSPVHVPQGMVVLSDAKHGEWRLQDGESDFLVCFKAMGDSFGLFF